MLYIQWKKASHIKFKLIYSCILLILSYTSFGQKEIYREEQDTKPYYFGLTLSTVYSRFQVEHNPSFIAQDSVYIAEPLKSPGISLRLVAAVNLSYRFELRFNPGLIFTSRPIYYKLKYPDADQGVNIQKSIESIITTF
ncbi:MAG TPA: hypothetical protein VFQ58_01785, partial [Flavisolibacter sp.]|nr:hypothetical protein [Flavisolibacter sp.]